MKTLMLMHPSKTWRPRAKYTLMQNGTYYYDKLRLVPTSWRLRPVSSKSSQRKTYIFKMLIVPPNKQSFSSTSVCNRCFITKYGQINDSTETFRFGMVFVPTGSNHFLIRPGQVLERMLTVSAANKLAGGQMVWRMPKLSIFRTSIKFGYSEKATKFEKIFHLKFDVTE